MTDNAAAHALSDPATDPFAVADAAAAVIRERTGVAAHDVALVLGSGWGQTGDLIGETLATIDNTDVPGFAKAAVAGHSGRHALGRHRSTGRAPWSTARTHYYEGHGVRAVVHGIRTAAAAGCRTVVITNGCGGLREEWAPGTPVLIGDHINLTATSPIEGANFVDLTDVYSPRLRAIAKEIDPDLDEGVYVQFRGPHYETPAEVRMAGILGGDLARHVDLARGYRRPPERARGAWHLARDQPGRRHLQDAAQPRRGPRGRPRGRAARGRLLAAVVAKI